jgi:hypothetical protein
MYIPRNIDISSLIEENPPSFKPFNVDKIIYIISLLTELRYYNKDFRNKHFIPLNSSELQKYIHNYKDYLLYLEHDLQIIKSDNHYIPGHKSKGYKLADKYETVIKVTDIKSHSLKFALRKSERQKEISLKDLTYLTKWFNKKFSIKNTILEPLLEREYIKKEFGTFEMLVGPNGPVINRLPRVRHNIALISSDKIDNKKFHLLRDDNIYRLHSPLTNMRSDIRNFLTYDNEPLISIDIKNCQPYLSILLLSKNFWKKKDFINNIKSSQDILFSKPCILHIRKYYNRHLKPHIYRFSNIMLEEVSQTTDMKDVAEFKNLVVKGQLYEHFQSLINQNNHGNTNYSRSEIKKIIFQVFFTDNRFIGQKAAEPKRIFRKAFPNVYKVFSTLKRSEKRNLSNMLQRLESFLVIDVICKKISVEYPDAPMFTIHDSIATTDKYHSEVKRIMHEVLEHIVGYPPSLKSEPWDSKFFEQYVEELTSQPYYKNENLFPLKK